jgi:hypothetical protein
VTKISNYRTFGVVIYEVWHCLLASNHARIKGRIFEQMTIKIISTRRPAQANLEAVEREEQILAVAKVVAAALGRSAPNAVDECAAKLRGIKSTSEDSMSALASDLTKKIHEFKGTAWDVNSLDLDIDRVMKLLEG